jgi:hypothetical protein
LVVLIEKAIATAATMMRTDAVIFLPMTPRPYEQLLEIL